jgi:hypothetical protein
VVESLSPGKYGLTTDVLGPDGSRVIEGEATVLVDDAPAAGEIAFEAIADAE